jgi:L,D-transpeptidase YcbB
MREMLTTLTRLIEIAIQKVEHTSFNRAARQIGIMVILWLQCSAALSADEPNWFNGAKPTPQAHSAVSLLASAAEHGLEPKDYDADWLSTEVLLADLALELESAKIALLKRRLTAAMQQYLSDLHLGRVDPRRFHHNFTVPRRAQFDPANYLLNAVANQRLLEAVKALEPPLPLYRQLREALTGYRKLVGHPAWQQSLPPNIGKQPYSGLPMLSQRLVALGDLAPINVVSTDSTTTVYEGVIKEGVMAFQRRHGLPAQGNLGKATLAQLNVQPASRVRQIELALERLRWTPLMQERRMVVINVPEFVLRAYEVGDDQKIQLRQTMKVIVGKAADTRTPLFDEAMRSIEFSPYWNVPPSIARNELVPQLRRDPRHLEREGFEFVDANGQISQTVSSERLTAVLAGNARIRQRPGLKNALGDIKFVFPNREHIYLHYTPAKQLFDSARRDFSHGCIRVENPVALAKFVLENTPQWNEQRIRGAMGKGVSSTLRLTEPVRVLIAYGTTLILNEKMHFFEDLYGYDRLLSQALKARVVAPY